MLELIKSYLNFKSVLKRIKNRNISWFTLCDSNCEISVKAYINRFVVLRSVKIGDYSFIGPNSNFYKCEIGKFCSISKNVTVGAFIHPLNLISTSPIFYSDKNGTGTKWVDKKYINDDSEPIFIGNDVWIGMNCTIMGGVKIGNGAVIGAHSLVTKDVPAYSIVGGVPARIIKFRFQEETIQKLNDSRWWDLSDFTIKENLDKFRMPLNDVILSSILNTTVDEKPN